MENRAAGNPQACPGKSGRSITCMNLPVAVTVIYIFSIWSQLAKTKARSEGWGRIIISIPLRNGIHGILAWIGPGIQLHELSAVVEVNKPGIG